jgi:hypothetical protein
MLTWLENSSLQVMLSDAPPHLHLLLPQQQMLCLSIRLCHGLLLLVVNLALAM